MWSISVEPTPSRIVSPYASFHLRQTSAGSDSAAATQWRIDFRSRSRDPSKLRIALYRVGAEKKRVGFRFSIVSRTVAGVCRPAWRMVDAPTQYGSVRLLPKPYAWKRPVVEKVVSLSLIPSTCSPYVTHVKGMSCCRCTTAFGLPVE